MREENMLETRVERESTREGEEKKGTSGCEGGVYRGFEENVEASDVVVNDT